MFQLLKFSISCLVCLFFQTVIIGQTTPKFSVVLANHYSKSYFSGTTFNLDHLEKGTYSWGIAGHYHFKGKSEKRHFSIGFALQRVGSGGKNLWEDSTLELEETYGQFPITVKTRNFVYYTSFPLALHFTTAKKWSFSPNISLEYPLGIGFFSKYESADGERKIRDRVGFDLLAFYPALFSLGAGFQVGKEFPLNQKYSLLIAGKFNSYSLLAFRSHDDFRIQREEYPYSFGLNVGLVF